jgi:DNA-binding NarL/FixJ family response regulator
LACTENVRWCSPHSDGSWTSTTSSTRCGASGGTALDPEVVVQRFSRRRVEGPIERLTPRETEVLALLAYLRS